MTTDPKQLSLALTQPFPKRYEEIRRQLRESYDRGVKDAVDACALLAERIASECTDPYALGVAMFISEEIRRKGARQ